MVMQKGEVRVRKAERADMQSVVELSFALFQEDAGQRDPFVNLDWPRQEGEEYYAGIASGHHSVCFVAEVDGSVVGFLTGYVEKMTSLRPVPMAELESMFVRKSFRGQRIGTQLVDSFLAWCREKGTQRVSVTAYSANSRAIEFYKGLGFEPRNLTLEVGLDRQEVEP
jgi:GNAT superfamily N-acetyltransferase